MGEPFKRRGMILIFTLAVLVALSGLAVAYLNMVQYEIKLAGLGVQNMRAFNIAEAGREKARYALTTGAQAVGWSETASPFGANMGTYIVTTTYSDAPTNQHVTITSSGYIPNDTSYVARKMIVEKSAPLEANGTNLSIGATATASSTQSSNVPALAIDQDQSTSWRSNTGGSSWLSLDLGSATSFNRVVVTGNGITSPSVQYSSNGTTWTAVSGTSGAIPGTYNFTQVSARYLRLNVSGNKPRVYELETYNHVPLGQGSFNTSW